MPHFEAATSAAAPESTTQVHVQSRWVRIAPWLAASAAVLAYANTLGNKYAYDDLPIVKEGTRILQPGKWLEIWTTDYWHDLKETAPNRDLLYRPLTLASIRLVHSLTGESPLPQRILNIALHGLIAAMLVGFCKTLGLGAMPSLLCGLLFAVLPIHSENVNAVVGRADLLVTLFVVLAMYSHSHAWSATTGRKKNIWRAVAGICAFAAMASKENGLTVIPLVVLAHLWFKHQSIVGLGSIQSAGRRTAYLIVPLAAYLALRYYAFGGRWTQGPPSTPTINALVGVSAAQRVLGAIQLWGMYWGKTIWPAILKIKYTVPTTTAASSPFHFHVLVGLGTILAAGWFAVRTWRGGRRYPAYLLSALLISYFPTSNALVLIQEFFAERLWYLPSFFALAFVATIASHYLSNSRRIILVSLATALIAIAMIARTWVRNREWNGNAALYAAAYRDAPNSVGVLQLYGDWLARRDESAKGIELLKKALEIDPGYIDAHRSLADAYLQLGDSASAQRHLEIIDRLAPGAASYNNLGVAYARQGNLARAEQEFCKALADPKAAPFAHYNLGMICYRTNRPDDAVFHLEESMKQDPASATILDLGRLYVALGRPADAVRVFTVGTQRHADDSRFWHHLATLLATSLDDDVRNGKEAVVAAKKAYELSGNRNGEMLAMLAAAYAEAGSYPEAVETARRALQIAESEGNSSLSEQIRGQIALYEMGKPFRDPRF